MASKPDLVKIGIEAFDIIDEYFGRKSRNNHVPPPPQRPAAPSKEKAPPTTPVCRYPYQPQQALVYHHSISEERIISYDAKKLHDGLPIMDYPKSKSAAMAY